MPRASFIKDRRSKIEDRKLRSSILCILCLLLAFGLRSAYLGSQELSGDEAFSTLLAQEAPQQIVTDVLQLGEGNPPLDFLLRGTWQVLLGDREYATRWSSVFYGLLSASLLYRLVKEMLNRRSALWALFIFSLAPGPVWIGQDARAYALALLTTVAATLAFWRALQRGRGRDWALWVLSLLTALYTFYFTVWVALAQGLFLLWHLLSDPRLQQHVKGNGAARVAAHNAWRPAALSVSAIALLYTPWIVPASQRLLSYRSNGSSPPLTTMIPDTLSGLLADRFLPGFPGLLAAIAVTVLLTLGLVTTWRSSAQVGLLLLLLFSIPIGSLWLISLFRPFFIQRYAVTAVPALLTLAGAALGLPVRRGWRMISDVAGVVCFALAALGLQHHYFDPQFSNDRGWREVAALLAPATAADMIAVNYPTPTLWYYYRGPAPHITLPPAPQDTAGTEAALQKIEQSGAGLWFVQSSSPGWDDPPHAAGQADDLLDLRNEQKLPYFTIGMYRPRSQALQGAKAINARLGDWGELLAARVNVSTRKQIEVTLYWQASQSVPASYKVFVHALGPDGQLWGQADSLPHGGKAPTNTWRPSLLVLDRHILPLKPNAPAGAYTLLAGLYDEATAQRVPARDAQNQSLADNSVPVVQVQIP